jgi:CxxC motif-containing protein (DUF1111 family)
MRGIISVLMIVASVGPAVADDVAETIREGKRLFNGVWTFVPAQDDAPFVGLGPVYNDISCLGCHVKNGRGAAPSEPDEPMHGMLVRLSVPGAGPNGGPNPHPVYGDQLNDHTIPGAPAEGEARLSYNKETVFLADGEKISLRRPRLEFRDLQFGALGPEVLTSPRVAQPVFGDGELEAVAEADILAEAARQTAGGGPIHGRPNRVWSIVGQRAVLGRFGWKANQPSLEQQAAGAANGDMGLTSPLFPGKNCTATQQACAAAPRGPQPELSAERLLALVSYLKSLPPPERRNAGAPEVKRGEAVFAQLTCGQCHKPEWRSGGNAVRPYSDMLLHAMGADLADGRPDFEAGGQDWRTPPLWGLGLTRRLNPAAGYLHDGRAQTITEAILWHGGEAKDSRNAFTRLSAGERNALLAFLNDL